MNKKIYQQPTTIAMSMQPQTILCGSVGQTFISTTGDPVSGVYGD